MKNLKQASNNSLAQRKALKDMKDNLSEMLSDMESALSGGGDS
jgi:phosphate uptake regulator